jgi:hypothetical protein
MIERDHITINWNAAAGERRVYWHLKRTLGRRMIKWIRIRSPFYKKLGWRWYAKRDIVRKS